ncbi:MAG: hypothetical protein NT007_18230 [Candidatus Kapabacteria bacterium]|nr:hypothetical protein [Candidatus Kapabacteria bacterium]
MRIVNLMVLIMVLCCMAQAQPDNYNPKDPNFFPIGVATQSPFNAKAYRQAGINLYITLWDPLDSIQLNDLHKADMKVICTQNNYGLSHLKDTIIYGWDQMDEPDNAQWNDSLKIYDPCVDPAIIIDRYNKFKANDNSRPVYLNLGQGVSWIQWYGRGSKCYGDIDSYKISKDGYIKGSDIMSFDIYPSNSADTATKDKLWLVPKGIDSLYSWGNNSKPAWCWIETTQISDPPRRKPTPTEVKAEVWMALIHGAKGFGYFCHSWYPTFCEWALLKDSVMLSAVKKINEQVTSLASVLNSPNSKNFATVSSSNPKVPIDIMTKNSNSNYIFAVAMRNDTTTATFSVNNGDNAEVIGENRTINIVNEKFSDGFNSYGVHLYKITSSKAVEEEFINQNDLNLFPNPTMDYVELPDELLNSKIITIQSIIGEIVYEGKPEKRIDISALPVGIYILKSGAKILKFVKM